MGLNGECDFLMSSVPNAIRLRSRIFTSVQTKKIGNFLCQKAVSNFRGRDYVAWFAKDIPVHAGPWKFYGLPGLILEVYDENGKFHIQAQEIIIDFKKESCFIQPDVKDFSKSLSMSEYLKKRKSLITDLLRTLKPGGLFSFQMGFGEGLESPIGPRSSYYDNSYEVGGTNSKHDVRVHNEGEVVLDLLEIGYTNIKTEVRESYSDSGHTHWIYVKAYKPE